MNIVRIPTKVAAVANRLGLCAGFASAQQIGVLMPTNSTYGLDPTTTFITPYVATQPIAVTTWKGNFPDNFFNGVLAAPAGIQLKIFRHVSPTLVQVVSVGQLQDPRSAIQAIPGYPHYPADAGIVAFTESNVNLLPGDIVGLTVFPDPIATQLYYNLVSGSDTRSVLHDVALGGTVDLSDPFTGTLPAEVPAILINGEPPANLSGYELFPGFRCTDDAPPARCGVLFGGWTGGNGGVAGGWTAFPGDGKGLWSANVDYAGTPGFGNTATLVDGNFHEKLKNGTSISGVVTGGTVQWPSSSSTDTSNPDCGPGVAKIVATLTISGAGVRSFTGCLLDLPAGKVIPPIIWGTLQ